MRVLIAYDGSAFGDVVLGDLYRAGLHDVDALVLSVTEVWLPNADMLQVDITDATRELLHAHQERAMVRGRGIAARAAAWLGEHFPRWRVATEGAAGSATEMIVSRAATWGADLVITGAHGHAAGPHMFPGSVSLSVLRHVPQSVRIARRPKFRGNSATRLIIGADGSEDSQRVLEHLRTRVWPADTEIQVVTVVDTRLAPMAIPGLAIGPTCESWCTEVAEKGAEFLRLAGLRAFAVVERGDPRRVLLDAARGWAADCVFVGARGLNRLSYLNLGNVSAALAMRAPCSVEVVRPAMERHSER